MFEALILWVFGDRRKGCQPVAVERRRTKRTTGPEAEARLHNAIAKFEQAVTGSNERNRATVTLIRDRSGDRPPGARRVL